MTTNEKELNDFFEKKLNELLKKSMDISKRMDEIKKEYYDLRVVLKQNFDETKEYIDLQKKLNK